MAPDVFMAASGVVMRAVAALTKVQSAVPTSCTEVSVPRYAATIVVLPEPSSPMATRVALVVPNVPLRMAPTTGRLSLAPPLQLPDTTTPDRAKEYATAPRMTKAGVEAGVETPPSVKVRTYTPGVAFAEGFHDSVPAAGNPPTVVPKADKPMT